MKTGKISLCLAEKGDFTVEEIPVPEPKEDEALIKQELCGICGTDVHAYWGWLPLTYPIVLGHEPVGTIEKLGDKIETDITGLPIKEGDFVHPIPGLWCGRCYACKVLREPTLCEYATAIGYNPFPDDPKSFRGGFAEYIITDHFVQKYNNGLLLKMNAPAKAAVLAEPLCCGIHMANDVKTNPEDIAVIQGSGAIGLSALIALRELVSTIIVIGAPQYRLDVAKRCGADMTINIDEVKDPAERIKMVKDQTFREHGADLVVEATGVPAAVPEGFEMVRKCGTYAIMGHYTDSGEVKINPWAHINSKQTKVIGISGSDVKQFPTARKIIESGKYPLEDLVTHVLPLDRVKEGMDAMKWANMSKTSYQLDGKTVGKIAISGSL